MATTISTIETLVRRNPLMETTASLWTSAELVDLIILGIKDLWRAIVDLKQEHYLVIDNTNVSLPSNTSTLLGVPTNVHKVYLIEPKDTSNESVNKGLLFKPLDYNHPVFQMARSHSDIDPSNNLIYYAIVGAGGPVNAPEIRVAPQVNSVVSLSFSYVPVLDPMTSTSNVPIPGEADNALICWTGAYARAKERENRGPDPEWLALYATEKQNLLSSLGLRQLQEPTYVDAIFQNFWG